MQEKLLIISNFLGLIWYNSELSIPQALAKLENHKDMYVSYIYKIKESRLNF